MQSLFSCSSLSALVAASLLAPCAADAGEGAFAGWLAPVSFSLPPPVEMRLGPERDRRAQIPRASPRAGMPPPDAMYERPVPAIAYDGGFLGVRLLEPMRVTPGKAFAIHLPSGIFRHRDPQVRLALRVVPVNGGALPAWLAFDPRTNLLSGTAPPVFEDVHMLVTASDREGSQASVHLLLLAK